jgi:hypothetical protein
MATIESASQLGVGLEVDPTFSAARASLRPIEYIFKSSGGATRVGGHYKFANNTSGLAFAANCYPFYLRNADPSILIVLFRVAFCFNVVTAISTAQAIGEPFIYKATQFTADPSAGGGNSALTVANAMRGTMAPPTVHIGATSSAAGFTGFPASLVHGIIGLGAVSNTVAALGSSSALMELYNAENGGPGSHPLVLYPNEGIQVQFGNVAIGTGTISCNCAFEWAEVSVF